MSWFEQTNKILLTYNIIVNVEGNHEMARTAVEVIDRFVHSSERISPDFAAYDASSRQPTRVVSGFEFQFSSAENAEILLYIDELDLRLARKLVVDLNKQNDLDLIIIAGMLPADEKAVYAVQKEISAYQAKINKKAQKIRVLFFKSRNELVGIVYELFIFMFEDNAARLERYVVEAESSSEEEYLYQYVIFLRSFMCDPSPQTTFYQLSFDQSRYYKLGGSGVAERWWIMAQRVKQQLMEVMNNYLEYEVDNFNQSTDYFMKDQLEMVQYCLFCYHKLYGRPFKCKFVINIPENVPDREISNVFLVSFVYGQYHLYQQYTASPDVLCMANEGEVADLLAFAPHEAPAEFNYDLVDLIDLCKRYLSEMFINFGYDSEPILAHLFGLYLLQDGKQQFIFGFKLFTLIARYLGLLEDSLYVYQSCGFKNLLYVEPFTKTFRYIPGREAFCKNPIRMLYILALKTTQFIAKSSRYTQYYVGCLMVILTSLYNLFRTPKYDSHPLREDLKFLFCFEFILVLKTEYYKTLSVYSQGRLFSQAMQLDWKNSSQTQLFLRGDSSFRDKCFVVTCSYRHIIKSYRYNVCFGRLEVEIFLAPNLVAMEGLLDVVSVFRYADDSDGANEKALSASNDDYRTTLTGKYELHCENAGRLLVSSIRYVYRDMSIRTLVTPGSSQNYSIPIANMRSVMIFDVRFPDEAFNGIPFPVRICAPVSQLYEYEQQKRLKYVAKIEQSMQVTRILKNNLNTDYTINYVDDSLVEITQNGDFERFDVILLLCAATQCSFKLSVKVEQDQPQFSKQFQVGTLMSIKKRKMEQGDALFYQFANNVQIRIRRILCLDRCILVNGDAFRDIRFPMELKIAQDYEKYALLDAGYGFIVRFCDAGCTAPEQCTGRLGYQETQNGAIFVEIESELLAQQYNRLDCRILEACGVFSIGL